MNKIYTAWSDFKFFSITLDWPTEQFDDKYLKLTFALYRLYVNIPIKFIKVKIYRQFGESSPRYGFSFHSDMFWIYLGKGDRWITFDMPWQYTIVRHDLLLPNGSLYHRNNYPKYRLGQKNRYITWFDVFEKTKKKTRVSGTQVECAKFVDVIHYTKTGKKQVAKIRLAGEEREWRMKWFTWLPLFRKIQRTVDCNSDIELGERAGSWKGGRMGWSCEWRKDESMISAFNRWYKNWNGD